MPMASPCASGWNGDMSGIAEVQCPSCFEVFSVAVPPVVECPADLDYDCEVCCRPMVIAVDDDGDALARGLDDSISG
ncbi:MAG: CPXCG motif-containing cysteine-rich protein, partial [Roseibacillus sp.]|nr:CPXCG motif-containing cysteine-rich protein [Roseibacillus sp.]